MGASPQDHIGPGFAVQTFIRNHLGLNSEQISENLRYRGRLRDSGELSHS